MRRKHTVNELVASVAYVRFIRFCIKSAHTELIKREIAEMRNGAYGVGERAVKVENTYLYITYITQFIRSFQKNMFILNYNA